jgi:hypothetical protein
VPTRGAVGERVDAVGRIECEVTAGGTGWRLDRVAQFGVGVCLNRAAGGKADDALPVAQSLLRLRYIDGIPADPGLRVRLTTARAVLKVGEDPVTLSAAGSTFAFAPTAEPVLRPLVDGRTVDLAALAETAGLDVEDAAGLVQELAAGQAATVGSLL